MKKKILFILILVSITEISGQTGLIKSYYPSRALKSEEFYVKDIYDGTSKWYYENGNLMTVKEYNQGALNGFVRNYFETGLLKEEIRVNMGVRNGIYKSFYENGALKEVRTYEEGRLVEKKELEIDLTYIPPISTFNSVEPSNNLLTKDQAEFICIVEECPRPIGGMKYIYDYLFYPDSARENGIEGEVVLIATVDINGFVKDVNLIQGIGYGCDEEAIKTVSTTRFFPGRNNDNPVQSDVTMRIRFTKEHINKEGSELVLNNMNLKSQKVQVEYKAEETPRNTATVKSELKVDFSPEKTEKKSDSKEQKISVSFDENKNIPIETKKAELKITCDTEECPKIVGGIQALQNELYYPKEAIKKRIEGVVYIEAEIDENGEVTKTIVLNKIGGGCDLSAEVSVMYLKFIPGFQNGKPVKSIVKIPVEFKLKDQE